MICNRCLRAASRSSLPIRNLNPYLSTRAYASPPTASTTSTSSANPVPDASSLAAQSASTSNIPSNLVPKVPIPRSSVPAGQVLRGLNILKTGKDPIALSDAEYPAWLWALAVDTDPAKKKAGADAGVDEGDLFSKSAKQRKKAAKALRKREAMLASRAPRDIVVPVHEQTVDLTLGKKRGSVEGNVEAAQARGEITKALRAKRRAAIKEANFLKSMS